MSKQNLFGRLTCGLYGITAWALMMPLPTYADETSAAQTPLLQCDDAQISLIQNTFIAAPIAGVVASVDTSEGDLVKVGTSLIRLNAEQAETELLAARSAYEAARLETPTMSTNDTPAAPWRSASVNWHKANKRTSAFWAPSAKPKSKS